MMNKIVKPILMVFAVSGSLVLAETIQGTVNMEFVPIADSNVGSAGDLGYVDHSYRIGVTEVSYAQFAASGLGNGNENYWVSTVGSSDAPVARVSWHEAAMYCNWLTSGNANLGAYTISGGSVTGIDRDAAIATYGTVYAMPTENEWYKAAYYTGSGYSLYADGTSVAPTAGVDTRYDDSDADWGDFATESPWAVGIGTTNYEQNGTYDMMGNIFEQTETLSGGQVVYRGGGYWQPEASLQSGWSTTDSATAEYYTVGMRVVAVVPEPGTISLMSLSTVGLFLTRRIRRRNRIGQSLMPIHHAHLCDTFYTEDEWRTRMDATEEVEDYLDIVGGLLKEGGLQLWAVTRDSYKHFDKAFWNRMVVAHERKLQRRIAFRNAFRKKVMDGFDAFLALIMK